MIASKFGGGGSGATDFPFVFHAQLTQFDPNGVPVAVLAQEAPSVEKGTWRLFDDAFYYTSDTIPHEANGWQGANRGGYGNAEADRLDHAYFTTIDPLQRRDILVDILKFVSVELPYLAFYYNVDTHAVRAGLHGIGSRYDRQPGMAFNIYEWYWR